MRSLLLACFAVLVCGALPAAEPAPEPKPVDLKVLPANQWVERPLSGWPGKTWYGNEVCFGLASAGELGVLVLDMRQAGRAVVRHLDAATGAWSELASAPIDAKNYSVDGSSTEAFHGLQLCYDPDRKALVGLTATSLGGSGRTIEFDLTAKTATAVELQYDLKSAKTPPPVTAGSLCYDPVNKEAVLATGGFSPVGGTDGTWLYDGAKKEWRRLETPKEMDEVRLPLEQARDRLIVLRWLVWKNLEFRATGREKLLDERSKGEALAKEAAELAPELKKLGELAGANSAKAERPYHKDRLASAGKRLAEATAKLAGMDGKIKTAGPEELEVLYRGAIRPALDSVETAVSELASTPEPRSSARLVYDSKNKLIVCTGGDGQCRAWDDTWVYHCEGRWWEWRQPAGRPSGGSARGTAFDQRTGLVVSLAATYKDGHHTGWQVWLYDGAANEWRLLGPAGAGVGWLEYDAKADCLVGLTGGMDKTAWVFRPDATAAKPAEARPATPAVLPDPGADFVLRDAATVADLKKWQAERDAWVKGVPANTWAKVPTNGTGRPNWGRSWSSIVYDPDRWQIYYRDGGHGSYHGSVTDHYDLPTGRWFRSDRRYEPPWPMGTYFGWGRSFSLAPWCVHSYKYGLYYNVLRRTLQREPGQSGGIKGIGQGVLEYDPDTGRWAREMVPVPSASNMIGGPVIPGVPDAVVCVRNFSRYGTMSGEGWMQTADGATKTWKGLGEVPRAWEDHAWCWSSDLKRKRVIYYGGPKDKQALFALDITAEAPKWQKLEVKGADDGKMPLSSREIVYVPRHDVFLMLAGSPESKDLEVWSLDAKENLFRRVPLAREPGVQTQDAGVSQGLQYDPVSDLCFYIAAAPGVPTMLAFRYAPKMDK
jgi:hypothetical protein